MPRPKGSADLLEDRRRRALHLVVRLGCSFNEAARRMGCGASSVMRWYRAWRKGGNKALRVRFSPGRPPKLGAQQCQRLLQLLVKGPIARGYRTNLWTTARIARLIKQEFGVQYHPNHIGRLMHRLGWSHQKPERRAVEANDQAIEQWKRGKWRRIKKKPLGWGPT
jgi:transposase